MPGVQKPHCRPWFSLNAACIGCSVPSGLATPSIVRMSVLSACMATIEQLLIALPFMRTAQCGACTDVGAGEPQLFADEGHQQGPRLEVGRDRLAVDLHGYLDRHAASFKGFIGLAREHSS